MDLLQYGDDSDREDIPEETIKDVKIRTWLTDDEESEDEDTDEATTKKRLSNAKEKNMLSADELFSQNIEKPVFSKNSGGEVFEIRATTE